MRDPASQAAYDRLVARFGRLYVVPLEPPEPYRAPPHPRRTVPRWSFELEAVDSPITEPVSKFGGQPVWIGDADLAARGRWRPATFMAQFTIPGRDGMAYLFLDYAAMETDDDWGVVIVQPGPVPDRTISCQATGPTFWSDVPGPDRYLDDAIARRVESLAVLEAGSRPRRLG